jgi:hypothetical protein
MSTSLERIFSEVAQFSKTMGGLHNDYLQIVRRDINRFLEETNNLTNQRQWQGWTIFGLTAFSASFAIAAAWIPKTSSNATSAATTLDPRTNANDGLGDFLKGLGEKFKDNDFLRSNCKIASKFFEGIKPVSDAWNNSEITETEAKRSLLESANIRDGQSKKEILGQQVEKAQTAALRILESKSKGG